MTHDLDNPDPSRLELQARLERVLLRLDPDKPAVSASTHSAYLKACRRGLLLVPGVWGHEASPRTRSYRRAAFRYWARTQLYDRYDILAGREPRFGTVAPESFGDRGLDLVHDIEEHLTVCEGHLDAFDRTDVEFPPKPKSKSKLIGLSTLPRGWRTRLWEVVPKNAPYRDAIAVMSVIGARPMELTKGIGVRLAQRQQDAHISREWGQGDGNAGAAGPNHSLDQRPARSGAPEGQVPASERCCSDSSQVSTKSARRHRVRTTDRRPSLGINTASPRIRIDNCLEEN